MADTDPAAAELAMAEPRGAVLTAGELAFDIPRTGLSDEARVMLRVRGEVFDCTLASVVFEEGRYVLMLDGETRD
jgi:hypothetical protein